MSRYARLVCRPNIVSELTIGVSQVKRASPSLVPLVPMSEPGAAPHFHSGGHHSAGDSHAHSHGHLHELEPRYGDDVHSEDGEAFSSFDDGQSYSQSDMDEELAHYEAVLGAMAFYGHASRLQFQRLYRQFSHIPEAHQRLFERTSSEDEDYLHPVQRINMLHEASHMNAIFLDTVLARSDNFLAPVVHASPQEIISRPVQPTIPPKNPLSGFNADKVHSTLCQLAREWSSEGAEERLLTFSPLLTALETYLPVSETDRYTRT